MEKISVAENISIIPATINDWEIIQYIQKNDGYPHSYFLSKDRLEKLISKDQQFFLLCKNNQPIGFCCIDYDIRAWIHFFSILSSEHRKGFGTLLMKRIISEGKRKQSNLLIIFIQTEATTMNKFLSHMGFIEAGFHKDRFGAGKDALIFNFFI